MAIDRFLLQDDRILLSKLGKTVSLTMADADKTFDSNWDFTGTVLARGVLLDTSPNDASNIPGATQEYTLTNTPYALAVPLPFTPRELLITIQNTGRASQSTYLPVQNALFLGREIPTNRITFSGGTLSVARALYLNQPNVWERGDLIYRMYAV